MNLGATRTGFGVLVALVAVCLLGTSLSLADQTAELAMRVDAQRLFSDIQWLADDDRNGRLPTTEEEDEVVIWIARRFAELGLVPFSAADLGSLVHPFPIRTSFYAWEQETGGSCMPEGAVLLNGEGENVIAVLPGERDSNEFVIVSAHHDHLGLCGSSIRSGADDNASGVAALLEIARILSERSSRLEKSVVFVAFCAEEIGRLGSRAFARLLIAHNLDRSSALVNLDMLSVSVNAPLFATLFGDDHRNTAELTAAFADASRLLNIDVVSAGSLIEWSDHVSLAEYRIPAVTLTASAIIATNEERSLGSMLRYHPNYHSSSDTAESVDIPAVTAMTGLAVVAVSILAAADR